METYLLDWICDSLGLPMVHEDATGRVVANAAAREVLGEGTYPSLVTAVKHLLGDRIRTRALDEAASRARRGAQVDYAAGDGQRVLFAPEAEGRARAVIAPSELVSNAALRRRAASTDITAGVSHELANALGAIAGWARLAKDGERVDEALELIEKSAHNAWAAARQVLGDVSGRDGEDAELLDFSGAVDDAARLLAPKALSYGVNIHTDIEPGLCTRGDRGDAWSVVWNLATNAVEALPPEGHLHLTLKASGDQMHLTVQDDGPGIDADAQKRIFEPYFTTKNTGTGLGLAMVKQAVENLGGTLSLHSSPGEGTRFEIELPRVEGEAGARRRRRTTKRSSGVFYAEHLEGRILVVDDDAGLREMIATALGMRGADVVAVSRPSEALRQRGPFEIAIIDLLMPDMRGDALLAALRENGVVEKGMLVTGMELPLPLANGGEPDAVLRKPFELEDLFERLAETLAGDDQSRHSATG